MKFKVGQRVAVYGLVADSASTQLLGATSVLNGVRGTVEGMHGDGLEIILDEKQAYIERASYWNRCIAHHKQCRKLVKKERRRVWVDMQRLSETNDGCISFAAREQPFQGGKEFIEVRRKGEK